MAKGRKKNTPGKNQSITKKAAKNFKAWNEKREDKTEVFARCKTVKYWYVSDKGTVISFHDSEEPVYLKIHTNKNGYKYVTTKKSGAKGTQYIHRLQAEAFNVYAYGNAKRRSLDGLEVHHAEADKRNEPGSEEILEPTTHEALFNKKNVPGINDAESEHYEYMETVAEIARENTPDQAVVVFPGTGVVNGEETKDLTQAIYADDFPGVTELINHAIESINSSKSLYALYEPVSDKDRDLYGQLLKTPGEEEKLNAFVLDKYKIYGIKKFDLIYENIELKVTILSNIKLEQL